MLQHSAHLCNMPVTSTICGVSRSNNALTTQQRGHCLDLAVRISEQLKKLGMATSLSARPRGPDATSLRRALVGAAEGTYSAPVEGDAVGLQWALEQVVAGAAIKTARKRGAAAAVTTSLHDKPRPSARTTSLKQLMGEGATVATAQTISASKSSLNLEFKHKGKQTSTAIVIKYGKGTYKVRLTD